MKKNLKKLSSLALAFLLVFSLSVSAFAADVSADKAKSIALRDADYSKSEVSGLYAESDYDNGVKHYDVSFFVKQADGGYLEYDYEVRVSDGKILKKEVERENGSSKPSSDSKNISESEAKKLALAHFGVSQKDVKFLEVKKDYDDGRQVYDIEFCKPYSVKYSCEVDASSKKVRDAEKESVRGLGEKLELFFEVFLWSIFNK